MGANLHDIPKARLYRMGGPDQAPDLLLIHGFGSDRFSWSATAPAFLSSHSVWAVELPGHGEAETGSAYDPASMAVAVATAIAGQLKTPFPVVGHSLGGAVALELARCLPGAICHAVLLAPAGLGERLDDTFLTRFPELHSPEETEALLHKLVSRPRLISPQMVTHVLGFLEKTGRREGLRKIAACLRGLRPGEVPPGLSATIIWGEADAVNPLNSSLLASIPAIVHVLPDTGHMPHVEAARKTNAIILDAISAR